MDQAISYDRFSNPKQAHGDSENRQQRALSAFCARHKLTPMPQRFVDRGVSGYTGKHIRKGDLGRLEALAKSGAFPPGTVLVIEAWDRLGRLRPDEMIALISRLLKAGLRIGICRLDDIFCEDDFAGQKWPILSAFILLAHQESKQKSDRVAESWQQRKLKARETGELATARLPAWLQVINDKIVPIPAHVAAMKRIFHLAGAGSV